MLCYKYMSYERFAQSFKPAGVFLKVSRPAEFNDPFDCTGRIQGYVPGRLIESYGKTFRQLLSPVEFDLSTKVQSRRIFDQWYRILSLSDASVNEKPEEMLMWSHYGESAKGVRVGLEIDTDKYRLGFVDYVKDIPTLELEKVNEWKPFDDPEFRRFLKACLLSKHMVWSYERERRVVFRVNDPTIKRFSLNDDAEPLETAMMCWTPPKSVLKEVCLGSEFLQERLRYKDVNLHFSELRAAGFVFETKVSIRSGRYGFDVRAHELKG